MYLIIKPTRILLLLLFMTSITILACAGDGKDDEPAREGEGSTPERTIDEPMKAERISQEEYDSVSRGSGEVKLPENPRLPLATDAQYAYLQSSDGTPAGLSKISIIAKGEGGILVSNDVSINWGNDSEKPFVSKLTSEYDARLRPVRCTLDVPDLLTGEIVSKDIDFESEKFGIDYPVGPGGVEGLFKEIERPEGDIWPFFPHAYIDLAIIAACTGLPEDEINVHVLNLVQDNIDIFTLEFLREKNIFIEDTESVIVAREYEGRFNGEFYAWLYFDSDDILIKVEEVGGIIAELSILPGGGKISDLGGLK